MTDHSIVELFWQRKEEALSHTQRIYHGYLHTVAYRILANDQDSALYNAMASGLVGD